MLFMGYNMSELVEAFGINILSSLAFTALSSLIIYLRGQSFFDSVCYGILAGIFIFAIFAGTSKRKKKFDKPIIQNYNMINSQEVNAKIISKSPIINVNEVKLNRK